MPSILQTITLKDIQWPLILGGLGLFLFGIQYMGDGLKSYSEERLKKMIEKSTSTPFRGIIIGALVTCLIQSSSGTTALTIGFIRSGLMTLEQAIGIIMGANIGTTMTAVLVGLNFSDCTLYFLIIGAFLLMFASKKKTQYLGRIMFGFGCLFYGLDLMGKELKVIACIPCFFQITSYMVQNPLFSLIGGITFTIAIQSSSAVIAIIQQMYADGVLPLNVALPFMFGSNIGTTITAILASLGGSSASKRAATFHVIFNLFGALLFMLLLVPFTNLFNQLILLFNIAQKMQLALAHSIFNIVTTLMMYPFIGFFTKLIKKIIPSDNLEMTLNE